MDRSLAEVVKAMSIAVTEARAFARLDEYAREHGLPHRVDIVGVADNAADAVEALLAIVDPAPFSVFSE